MQVNDKLKLVIQMCCFVIAVFLNIWGILSLPMLMNGLMLNS